MRVRVLAIREDLCYVTWGEYDPDRGLVKFKVGGRLVQAYARPGDLVKVERGRPKGGREVEVKVGNPKAKMMKRFIPPLIPFLTMPKLEPMFFVDLETETTLTPKLESKLEPEEVEKLKAQFSYHARASYWDALEQTARRRIDWLMAVLFMCAGALITLIFMVIFHA